MNEEAKAQYMYVKGGKPANNKRGQEDRRAGLWKLRRAST